MAFDVPKPVWTEAQLMSLPKIGHKYELVEGKLTMTPAGGQHGDLGSRIIGALAAVVYPQELGWILDSSTGFWMKNGNLRSPDVSFIPRSRYPDGNLPRQFLQGAPELAVEILSPSESFDEAHGKMMDYFANGTLLGWVVNPATRHIHVYSEATLPEVLVATKELLGDPVLPGFRLPLDQIFRRLK